MTPLVSVVLAAFNAERFIDRTIRSVLEQTVGDLELIVVDDGSTDGTSATVARYLDDERVRCFDQPNAGQPSADNRGVREARGAFVAFVDADDVWLPRKLELQLPLFEASARVGVVYSPTIYVDEHDRPVPMWPMARYAGWITERLFVQNFVPFSTTIVRRECFDRAGLFDPRLASAYDYDLWLRVSLLYEFAMVDEPTVRYRVWPGQISNSFHVRYDCAMDIMRRFERAHPEALPPWIVREAWAHTFAGRGYLKRKTGSPRWTAAADYLRALRAHPFYVPAFKGFVETFVR